MNLLKEGLEQQAVVKTTLTRKLTVDGLTKDQMQSNSFQPDMLFEQISSYLDTLQTLCTK